tara:strand:+ start:1110 stop:1586 length:477 start_codon:yes stop_codon:yes gene_type:complete
MSNIPISNIIVSAILVDTIIAFYVLISKRGGRYIREYYKELGLSAYAMDILSITFGVYIALSLSKNFWQQLLLVVIVGLIHDVSFGYFLKNINAKGPILSLFKNYAKEWGAYILWVDASMLLLTLIISYLLTRNFKHENIIFIGVVAFYIGLLVVHSY